MHKINRRKLMVSGAIGAAALSVAAVPAIGLVTSLKAAPGKDRLFELRLHHARSGQERSNFLTATTCHRNQSEEVSDDQ
ncbi:MAG TPA: hypothetical protein DCL72_15120 [Rhizobiales bacterium]|jgi:hypothetical protein|nr:hypothetical protein [Hyphomicrobiales bacterium]